MVVVKKAAVFFAICILVCGSLYADELFPNPGFRFKDRTFEIGFLNVGVDVYNNMFSLGDFTEERMILDLDNLSNGGLRINTNLDITPFYFKVNTKNNWGFGLSLNVEATGNIGLSENLISFNTAINEKSDAGLAVFTDTSFDIYFHVQYYKIKIRPSAFFTVVYTKPDVTYTFNTIGTTSVSMNYDAKFFTALKIDDIDNIKFDMSSFSAKPGVDVNFGIEYPLSRATGLYKNLAIFDFDVGLDLLNIPIVASTMRHYIRRTGNLTIGGDTIEELIDSVDFDTLFDGEPIYGEEKILIERPFRTVLWLHWRLFGKNLLTFTPQIGFCYNPFYLDPFFLEYGLKAKLDLANVLILSAGMLYEEHIWKNSVGVALNLRIFELNIGADIRTKEFFRILNSSGVGVYAGIKFGF